MPVKFHALLVYFRTHSFTNASPAWAVSGWAERRAAAVPGRVVHVGCSQKTKLLSSGPRGPADGLPQLRPCPGISDWLKSNLIWDHPRADYIMVLWFQLLLRPTSFWCLKPAKVWENTSYSCECWSLIFLEMVVKSDYLNACGPLCSHIIFFTWSELQILDKAYWALVFYWHC